MNIFIKKLSTILCVLFISTFLFSCNKKNPNINTAVNTPTSKPKTTTSTAKTKNIAVKKSITVKQLPTEKPKILDKNSENTTQNKSDKATTTSNNKPSTKASTKSLSKTIVIDPGHADRSNLEKEKLSPNSNVLKIKDGGGAQGIVTKTPEYKINMLVAKLLKKELESKGYKVILTKTSHSESLGNIDRAEIGNRNHADLVIRIHADSAENSSANGASMLVPAAVGYAKNICNISQKYGSTILNQLTKEVGIKNRGISIRDDMTGFNWSKVPVVLVEMGFLSNSKEDKLLNSTEYQAKIATALANGICQSVK
ncbi:N-acetylmuramoyl-L-alanine amidase family protein [Haloimpatiens massiliensis]|uniref:N-acetylmuramoyl-L-alanine amidase family protein n=1 Tax=Haloimpatiens massiliensis TaxID=1658110 RepID=UPI000C82A04A|nr:N-acetylmuramoyl-L-alanine amidase [Haloimpatiens massiliensis]